MPTNEADYFQKHVEEQLKLGKTLKEIRPPMRPEIREALDFFCLDCHYNNKEIAEIIGVSEMTISNWRRGRVPAERYEEPILNAAAVHKVLGSDRLLSFGELRKLYPHRKPLTYLHKHGVSDNCLSQVMDISEDQVKYYRLGKKKLNGDIAVKIMKAHNFFANRVDTALPKQYNKNQPEETNSVLAGDNGAQVAPF